MRCDHLKVKSRAFLRVESSNTLILANHSVRFNFSLRRMEYYRILQNRSDRNHYCQLLSGTVRQAAGVVGQGDWLGCPEVLMPWARI